MRMIDTDLIQYESMLSAKGNGMYEDVMVAYKSQIDDLPTIERKTGMWLRAEFGVECNLCKRTQITMTPYCSHCGAEMDC